MHYPFPQDIVNPLPVRFVLDSRTSQHIVIPWSFPLRYMCPQEDGRDSWKADSNSALGADEVMSML